MSLIDFNKDWSHSGVPVDIGGTKVTRQNKRP